MHYPAHFLALGALLLCLGCGAETESLFADPNAERGSFATSDLDGLWQGVTAPLDPTDLPLELTLGFESYGNARSQVELTHYSFPMPRSTGVVDYLSLLSTYEIFYSSSGRLSLETRYLGLGSAGRFIDESITKVLWMDEDLQSMVGTENIRVHEAGMLTVWVDNVLRLDRVD